MSKGDENSGVNFGIVEMYEPGNKGKVIVFNGSFSVHSAAPITANTWHYLVMTNDGTTTKIYVDGALSNSGTQTLTNDAGLGVVIGKRTDMLPFNGLIDQVDFLIARFQQVRLPNIIILDSGKN